ncbi:MAG TPA: GNAT family N-acetyltransferase [Pyrinomonadaceae bacterium]|jgi:acetyl coenzyme A synthetase (ADP forming)-like protein|nr:GNAT family N-acetyltransferase [Pyrinomonadaceae bacterium]
MQTINTEIIHKSSVAAQPIPEMDNQRNENYSCAIGFPHRIGDVVLRDGSTVRIRSMQPSDDQALFALFQSLSEESRWLRFLSLAKGEALAAEARRESHLDRTVGLIAVSGSDERVVGHAFYAGLDGGRAEVAFTIADDFQGRGLGTLLLCQLAEIADSNGIQIFEAEVAAANVAMLNVFRESGFPIEVSATAGQLHVSFPTSFTHEAIERFERRESIAAVNALKLFFNPRSIAVIGASKKRGTLGGELFHNLLSYGFAGAVYPVNPTTEVVQSVPAYKSVEEIPGPVDLAVVVVQEKFVIDAVKACGRKGVKALVVISAGFGEVGTEGQAKQAELIRVCRAAGMRLIGPNCMGIINTDDGVRMDATFAPGEPPTGRVGFSSQSGALGLAIIQLANSLGLGISTFVSVGNKADISGNDLLRYWESDEGTEVILLYLESFGNPRKFSQIARRVGRKKPIVVVKSGRSAAGARATSSHTGALLAASDVTVDALFRQSGVIRTDTLEELFDVAALLVNQPLPKGNRVGIITNAGGPGILCADTCESRGLEVPLLSEATREKLRSFLAPGAGVGNPVDMIASAGQEQYRKTIEVVAADPNVDALIVCFTPPLVTRAEDVGQAIIDAIGAANIDKPILAVFLSADAAPEMVRAARIPSYRFPETAAIALARASRYRQWRERPEPTPARFDDLRPDEAASIVASALQRGDGWLAADETSRILSSYGLPLIEQKIVATPQDAADFAEALDDEVALKVIAPGVLHKTEAGGVRLNLRGAKAVRAAADEMTARLASMGHQPTGFLVQRMAKSGVEMLVGVVHDPQFGPVVACGAGGVKVELLRDVSIRLTPLSKEDAREMVRGLKTFPLLDGFRGGSLYDVAALEDALLRVSAMVEDLPQIAELDLNPFVVQEDGAVILDARMRLEAVEPRPLVGVRG